MADAGVVLLVGAGGLVGRHLRAALVRAGHDVRTLSVPWTDDEESVRVLSAAVHDLPNAAGDGPWSLVWTAGAGVVATSEADLARELDVFVRTLAALPPDVEGRGAMLLVSSAGGVHAGSIDPPFTEATAPRPLVAYGRTKLAMEEAAVRETGGRGIPLLVVRPSNVYGPGQRLTKAQGLISQLALAQAARRPMPVFVAQDTMRDYVYAPDVAELLTACLGRLHDQRPSEAVTKLVAAGLPVTVGHLIGETRRVVRNPVRTMSVAGRAGGQVADLRFRSTVWPDLDAHLSTPLVAGLAATVRDVLARVARGGDLDA